MGDSRLLFPFNTTVARNSSPSAKAVLPDTKPWGTGKAERE